MVLTTLTQLTPGIYQVRAPYLNNDKVFEVILVTFVLTGFQGTNYTYRFAVKNLLTDIWMTQEEVASRLNWESRHPSMYTQVLGI